MKRSRDELLNVRDWGELKNNYRSISFTTDPFEAVEKYAAKTHHLNRRLFSLQEFWRFHVAPATNRCNDTELAKGIHPAVSHIAQNSYEVYCNICDALDELKSASEAARKNQFKTPRYRDFWNVLLFCGHALHLFDDLLKAVGQRPEDGGLSRHSLLQALLERSGLRFRTDLLGSWRETWIEERKKLATYRDMLVHHGRPWLHFEGKPFKGPPYILKAEWCRHKGRFRTWTAEHDLFKKNKDERFITLPDACEQTCNSTITLLNEAYGFLTEGLDAILSNPEIFAHYRMLWAARPVIVPDESGPRRRVP